MAVLSLPLEAFPRRVKQAISALRKVNKQFDDEKTKKCLIEDSCETRVYLQVTFKKIPPKKSRSIINVHLPHHLMTDTSDVCLITRDMEKNNKTEIEAALYYKELLKKQGVNRITKVITLRQLRTEFKTYEEKRQLCAAYDMFICDKKIAGCLPSVLGKTFYDNRKFPVQINLEKPNLKERVEKAISKVVFNLSCLGNSCTLEVALLCMGNADIFQNILSCVAILTEKLPGGWENVAGLHIKTARSVAMPLYLSFGDVNDVKFIKKRARHQEKAEELSTVLNAKIKVFKDGRLKVMYSTDSEEVSDNESDIKCNTKKRRIK